MTFKKLFITFLLFLYFTPLCAAAAAERARALRAYDDAAADAIVQRYIRYGIVHIQNKHNPSLALREVIFLSIRNQEKVNLIRRLLRPEQQQQQLIAQLKGILIDSNFPVGVFFKDVDRGIIQSFLTIALNVCNYSAIKSGSSPSNKECRA